jgi:hypothetical protein
MSKRMRWERLRHERRPKLKIKDEIEGMAGDFAARWLDRREAWLEKQKLRIRKPARIKQRGVDE